MADLPIALALLAVALCAWRRPWVGVLGLVFVGVMVPQGYAVGWLKGAPAYQAIGAVVVLATLRQFIVERRWPALFLDWRFPVVALLAVQMVLSTWLGVNPWGGWSELRSIAQMLPVLVLVLVLIDDREKLRWLLVTIALSVAVVVLKGGYWAVFMGLQERVFGPPNSRFHDNNAFAVVAAMALPLLALWFRQVNSHAVRLFLGLAIVLGFVAVLSTWSRGGMLCAATVATLLVLHSRRKWLALPLLVAGLGLLFVGLPDAWFARMQTLGAPQAEGSAAARLQAWRLGWDYVLAHPWFGGGLASWVYLTLPMGANMVWHSAYVGVMVEHGFVGLALWCVLLFGTMLDLSWLAWRYRANRRLADHAAMLQASLAAYAVGAAFLSIAYWDLPYLVVAASVVLRRLAVGDPAPAAAPASEELSVSLTVRSGVVRRAEGA